jgi:plastocyanin
MNKYIILGVVLVALVGGGMVFSAKKDKTNDCTAGMGADKQITVISRKLEWRFDPESITVDKCDRVTMTVINEDNFDHGVAIDALGISQRLPANETIVIPFVPKVSGSFQFYCSVSCSDSKSTGNLKDGAVQTGPYKDKVRGHFDHLAQLIVAEIKKLIN